MDYKKCGCCGVVKTLANFYKDKTRKDGLSNRCSPCYRISMRAYNKSNKGISSRKEYNLQKKYGISTEEYSEILSKPCAICGSPSEVLDHDHYDGRNLEGLCNNCNKGLGFFKENSTLLQSAREYLIRTNKASKR